MEGIVILLQVNKGSKSEGIYAFLYCGGGKLVRLSTGNSLDGSDFSAYDGKKVIVTGQLNENDVIADIAAAR